MRTILKSHDEVAHYWANEIQPSGKSGNMFFRNGVIYSYGEHFPIARHVVDDNNRRVVLFTSRDYSVSTAKHKLITRRALSDSAVVFTVPILSSYHVESDKHAEHYLSEIARYQELAYRARKNKEYHTQNMIDTIRESSLYCDAFGKGISEELRKSIGNWAERLEADKLFSDEEKEKMRAAQRARLERERETRAARVAAERERLEKWRAGGPRWANFETTALRLSEDKTRIETSRGAEITVKAALRLWEHIRAGKSPSGMELNPYRVTTYDGKVLVVGCHHIPVAEIKLIADQLGVA